MAKQYYGSIDFDRLIESIKSGKVKTHKTDKGKRYVNISIWINDEVDEFKQIGSLTLNNKAEYKDEPTVYLANLRESKPKEITPGTISDETDDLPF